MKNEEEKLPNGKHREASKTKSKYGDMDLADFVFEVEKFSRLIEPISFLFYCCEDVRKWRFPLFSLILWILCNLSCLILSKGAVFALVSLLVICIATTCLIQLHTRLLDKFLPTINDVTPNEEEYDSDEETPLKTVQQFRFSLLQMYDFIVQCNWHLANIYRILRWDNTLASLRFHVELCIFLLCLVVLPSRAIFFLMLNWFFIGNEDVFKNIVKICYIVISKGERGHQNEHRQRSAGLQISSTENDANLIMNSSMDKSIELDNDPVNVKISQDEEDKISISSKPGMVARLMEMRKRRQHIANESCFKCEVSFASILKRRFYCRHCGNNFCSKCCNQKVPKSMFGATSPEAQKETVLVCVVCYDLLTSQGDKEKQT